MTRLTYVFLVLLRLAIGWHFLFEGMEKLRSDSWSSEGYLRESTGPLAPVFHRIAGDSVAERLTPKPIPPNLDLGKAELDPYFPPALEKEWQAWHDGFVSRYGLSDKQKEEAKTRFQTRKAQTVRWMLRGKVTVTIPSSFTSPVTVEKTVPQWIDIYQKKLDEAEGLEETEVRKSKGTPQEAEEVAKVRTLKEDANRIRATLRRALEDQTHEMHEALGALLTDEQWAKGGLLPKRVSPGPLKWGGLPGPRGADHHRGVPAAGAVQPDGLRRRGADGPVVLPGNAAVARPAEQPEGRGPLPDYQQEPDRDARSADAGDNRQRQVGRP